MYQEKINNKEIQVNPLSMTQLLLLTINKNNQSHLRDAVLSELALQQLSLLMRREWCTKLKSWTHLGISEYPRCNAALSEKVYWWKPNETFANNLKPLKNHPCSVSMTWTMILRRCSRLKVSSEEFGGTYQKNGETSIAFTSSYTLKLFICAASLFIFSNAFASFTNLYHI